MTSLRRGVVVCLALTLALFLILPWWDVLAGNAVPVLQALTDVWILAAGVGFLVALIARRGWAILAFTPALVLALAAAWLLTTSGATPSASAARGSHQVTVLSLNAELGGADADSILRLVEQRNPDIVVFVEMTKSKLDVLDQHGLGRIEPHRTSGMLDDGARGSVVLSRWPVTTVDADTHLGHYDLQEPVARIAAPGAPILVKAVHSYPPLQDGVRQWRPQLMRLKSWTSAQPDAHLLLAGDFNASAANPAFRNLRHGLTDAVAQVKTAAWPTWPHGSWMPPFVQIDHILVRGFAPQNAGIATIRGTDHAAIWATLNY